MSNTSRNRRPRRAGPRSSPATARGSADVSALEAHLGYWLRFVSNYVSQAFTVKVLRHGVTVAEWVIMRELFDREQVRPSELAERVHLTRGAVSKLLDRLVKKDLVLRLEDAEDRRAQVVALTQAGRRLVPRLARVADENDAHMFGHLDPERQAALLAVLKEMVAFHGLKGAPVD